METIPIKNLTIDYVKSTVQNKSSFCIENQGGELFQHPASENGIPENSLLVDMQSANVLCVVYDNLSDKNKANFNSILQCEYRLASLLDKMWSWVKFKR